MIPDSYFGMIEQERARASLSSQKYWQEQEKKRREARKAKYKDQKEAENE